MCLFKFHLFSLHKYSVDPVYVIASYTFSTVYHTKVQYLNPICGRVVVYMQYWFVLVNCVCSCVLSLGFYCTSYCTVYIVCQYEEIQSSVGHEMLSKFSNDKCNFANFEGFLHTLCI